MTVPQASVWFDGPKRGPWKVRWRTGEINPATTKPRIFASPLVYTAIDRDMAVAEKRAELKKTQAKAREARGGRMTIESSVAHYIKHHQALGKIGEAYAIEFAKVVERVTKTRWTYIDEVTADAIELWRAEVGGKGTDKPLQIIKRLVRWVGGPPLRVRVDDDVLRLAKRRRMEKPKPPLLTERQIDAILHRAAEFGPEIEMALEHLARYGCRPNELCRLIVSDWNPRTALLTHRKTKNTRPVTHGVDPDYAKRLTDLVGTRRGSDPLFRGPNGKAWGKNKWGKYQAIIDWYAHNVADHLNATEADIAAGGLPTWKLVGRDQIDDTQRGIYCLKDFAIQRMEDLSIDDETKSTFTAIKSHKVYARYKSTNADRNAAAASQIAIAHQGAFQGAPSTNGSKTGSRKPKPAKTKSAKSAEKSPKPQRTAKPRTASKAT